MDLTTKHEVFIWFVVLLFTDSKKMLYNITILFILIKEGTMSARSDFRRNEISKYIQEHGKTTIHAMAKEFHISLETLRKDLTHLENLGVIYRIHGGAMHRNANYDLPIAIRTQENKKEKFLISKEAIHFIQDNDTIFLDASSTVLHLGNLLKLKKNLTIVTNSYELVPILAESEHRILMVCGEYRRDGNRLGGHYTTLLLKNIYFDVCFLSSDGNQNMDGPGQMSDDELFLLKTVLDNCKFKVLLCDKSKFSKFAHYQYATYDQFDVLITNDLSSQLTDSLSVPKIINISYKNE